jgi:hypothetical protein
VIVQFYGALAVVRLSNTYLRFRSCAWSCTCVRCVCVGVLPPPYTLQGMDTWLRGIPRACVPMRPSVLCYLCDRVHVSVFAYRACDGLAPRTVGGADQALAVTVWIYTTWYLLDDGVFAWCIGTWVCAYTLVQHRPLFAAKAA